MTETTPAAVTDGTPGVASEPWYNAEDVDYTVCTRLWPAGGGPGGAWPGHHRVELECSVHGGVQSQPPTTELADLVIAAADHHQRRHGGPDWRSSVVAYEPANAAPPVAVALDPDAVAAVLRKQLGTADFQAREVAGQICELAPISDAEAKLAAITDACRSIPTPIAQRLLAIIGEEEKPDA